MYGRRLRLPNFTAFKILVAIKAPPRMICGNLWPGPQYLHGVHEMSQLPVYDRAGSVWDRRVFVDCSPEILNLVASMLHNFQSVPPKMRPSADSLRTYLLQMLCLT